jgi:hypothetical protein
VSSVWLSYRGNFSPFTIIFRILSFRSVNALPFQISAAANAPPGEAGKRAFASFMGVPIYGQTTAQQSSPEVRMERRLKRRETRQANKEEKMKRR